MYEIQTHILPTHNILLKNGNGVGGPKPLKIKEKEENEIKYINKKIKEKWP